MRRWMLALVGILTICLTSGCGVPGGVSLSAIGVRDAWARPATAAGAAGVAADASTTSAHNHGGMHGGDGTNTSAAYLTLVNTGAEADRLVGAATDAAAAVELHTDEVRKHVVRMQPLRSIEVPANGEVRLEPGGYHLMLLNVTRDLQPGETIALTLTFEKTGKVETTARIRER